MKFACDKCNTRYSIADERVRGRVLKIRCKACNNVITVREEEPSPPPADSLQSALESFSGNNDEQTRVSTMPPPSMDGADEWFVSFDGEQEGPLPLSRALDRVRAERPRGKECYCWRGGFFVWLPVEDVPEFAAALTPARAAPPPIPPTRPSGSHAAVKTPTGPQAALKSPTGSQAAVKSPTGSQAALGRTTGSHAAVGKSTGPQAAVKSPTGSQAAVGRTTGSQAAVKSPTGSQAAVGRTTGSQAAVGKSTGSHPKVQPKPAPASKPLSPAAEPAFDSELPPLDSGPLALPDAPVPALAAPMVTKPEPRLLRKQEEAAAESGPVASPFAAALKSAGGPPLPDSAEHATAAPKNDAAPHDSGPVPLPPPPSDLPIGEASGLISLSHISKPALAAPSGHAGKPVVDTFGGVPVTPAALPTPGPQPVVVMSGPARGAAPWMKWAAIGGGLATLALGVTVIVLMSRKPTVIVVPPAPTLDDGKKVDDKPITVADPGPTTTAPAPLGEAKHASKRPVARAASAPKPPATKMTAAERNLASLYRDEGEHGVPQDSPALARARQGGSGGQVSQQAIMAVVTQNRRSLNLCYDRVLKHDSSLKSGRVVTHVKIGISGAVTAVTVPDPQYANSEIGQCLTQTIKRWHFPSGDGEYETEFPIILQAN